MPFWYRIVDVYKSVAWFIKRDIPHRIKHGCSEKDIWNLDYTIAKFVLPRLKALKAWHTKYPSCPSEFVHKNDDDRGFKEWMKVMDKMILAFQLVMEETEDSEFLLYARSKMGRIRTKQYEEGMKLFEKYFMDLWS
jgi:hypothetical protein